MNRKLSITLAFISLIISGCEIKSFKVESKYENGNPEVISRPLTDTLIFGKSFQRKFKIKFAKNKDTLRKGVYINEIAIGDHLFFQNNQLTAKRNYIIPNPFFIDLDTSNETVDFSDYQIRSDSTYLNTGIFYDTNGDTIIDKSHYYKAAFAKDNWSVNDSLKVDFEFYYPNSDIVKADLYFIVPEDSSMVTLGLNFDEQYTFERKILKKEHNKIQGVVDLIARDREKAVGDSTAYARRIMFIHEKFNIN